ncbi:MAG: response regulator, partial [Pseudomonadales bacterium]|nr:response regulator [Pseudomonadales bacterium]
MKKILIADGLRSGTEAILAYPKAKDYEIKVVKNGPDALKELESFQPDLCLIELMLPGMHGIELLHHIREGSASIGVIITTFYTMIQNYRATVSNHANYFLEKPFESDHFFELVERFFAEGLEPDPVDHTNGNNDYKTGRYSPVPTIATAYVQFWGTRGSIPVAGSKYQRIGGNTCCLEVRYHDDLIIIDAGTGIRELGMNLHDRGVKNVHLFIGHTHWDHITGFPFF